MDSPHGRKRKHDRHPLLNKAKDKLVADSKENLLNTSEVHGTEHESGRKPHKSAKYGSVNVSHNDIDTPAVGETFTTELEEENRLTNARDAKEHEIQKKHRKSDSRGTFVENFIDQPDGQWRLPEDANDIPEHYIKTKKKKKEKHTAANESFESHLEFIERSPYEEASDVLEKNVKKKHKKNKQCQSAEGNPESPRKKSKKLHKTDAVLENENHERQIMDINDSEEKKSILDHPVKINDRVDSPKSKGLGALKNCKEPVYEGFRAQDGSPKKLKHLVTKYAMSVDTENQELDIEVASSFDNTQDHSKHKSRKKHLESASCRAATDIVHSQLGTRTDYDKLVSDCDMFDDSVSDRCSAKHKNKKKHKKDRLSGIMSDASPSDVEPCVAEEVVTSEVNKNETFALISRHEKYDSAANNVDSNSNGVNAEVGSIFDSDTASHRHLSPSARKEKKHRRSRSVAEANDMLQDGGDELKLASSANTERHHVTDTPNSGNKNDKVCGTTTPESPEYEENHAERLYSPMAEAGKSFPNTDDDHHGLSDSSGICTPDTKLKKKHRSSGVAVHSSEDMGLEVNRAQQVTHGHQASMKKEPTQNSRRKDNDVSVNSSKVKRRRVDGTQTASETANSSASSMDSRHPHTKVNSDLSGSGSTSCTQSYNIDALHQFNSVHFLKKQKHLINSGKTCCHDSMLFV
jgi:hypothetical protein